MKEYAPEGLSSLEKTPEAQQQAKDEWQQHLKRLWEPPHAASSTSFSGRASQLKKKEKERAYGYDHLRALYHTLWCVSLGLCNYLSDPRNTWQSEAPRPLRVGERRIYIKFQGEWPYFVPPELEGFGKNAVLINQDGDRKFELVEFSQERPHLALFADQGAKFWTCCWYMATHLKARISFLPDPGHRAWNDFRLAVDSMGWRPQLIEGCLILNFRHGPWLSCSWWEQLRAGVDEFIRLTGPEDELWMSFYPAIAKELGVDRDMAAGTYDHIEQVKLMMITAKVFETKGEKVALRSFFKWVRSMKEFRKGWHALLTVLIVIGARKGWFKPGYVPGVGVSSKAALLEVGELSPEDQQAAGCNNDQSLQQLRAQCQNSMHVVAEILGNTKKEFVLKTMALFGEPFQVEHDLTIKLMKGPEEALRYYQQAALGKFCFTAVKALRIWADSDTLAAVGITTHPADFGPIQGSAAEHAILKIEVKDENEKLELMWKFTWRLIQRRMCSMTHLRDGWPGPFSLLLSPKENERQEGMRKCEAAWLAISEGEEVAHTNTCVGSLMQNLGYNQMVPVRESLLALSQWSFQYAPPSVLDVWRTVFYGWGNSTVIEDGFNIAKDGQRDSKNTEMSRMRRWSAPIVKGIIAQRYDRKEVKAEPIAGERNNKLPQRMFLSQADRRSMTSTSGASWATRSG